MKIALCCIYSEPYGDKRSGGLITSAMQLQQYGMTPVAIGTKKKSHMDGWTYVRGFAELSREYDFIIFSSAGSIFEEHDQFYLSQLKWLTKPFAIQSHNAQDPNILKNWQRYFEHPMFRFFMPIHKDLWAVMPHCATHVYLAHKSHIDVGKFKKENLVASTSRMASIKRVQEFAKQSKNLTDAKFRVEIWGCESSFFYTRALKEINKGHWELKGEYNTSDLDRVLGPVKYHWNCTAYKKRLTFSPRLELTSIEAAERGCRLIVHRASTPRDYDGTCVMIDALDPNLNLAYEIKQQKSDPIKLASIFNDLHAGKEKRLMRKIRSVM